jgi:hypothetical protein
MLKGLKGLERYTVTATDGDIGSVVNFLFDDEHWVVRYLVVDTGRLFNGRRVLISPISFGQAERSTCRFQLALTTDKVKSSPSIDVDEPVSRQNERNFYRHYGYPCYWGSSGMWGEGAVPTSLQAGRCSDVPERSDEPHGDPHLRSVREVTGYQVQGSDGAIGHIADFIVDDESWDVRYLVVDTSNWWLGKKVLVAPYWASYFFWDDKLVQVNLSRQAVRSSPEWDAVAALTRGYEARLYDHYGSPAYWNRKVLRNEAAHSAPLDGSSGLVPPVRPGS